jgi:Co/Zn/Cd efflux system component
MACCHDGHCASAKPLNSPRWRRALWIALVINAGFFLAEIIAGAAAGAAALQADALDFFGDAANSAISLGVAGMVMTWRARRCRQGRDLDFVRAMGTGEHCISS